MSSIGVCGTSDARFFAITKPSKPPCDEAPPPPNSGWVLRGCWPRGPGRKRMRKSKQECTRNNVASRRQKVSIRGQGETSKLRRQKSEGRCQKEGFKRQEAEASSKNEQKRKQKHRRGTLRFRHPLEKASLGYWSASGFIWGCWGVLGGLCGGSRKALVGHFGKVLAGTYGALGLSETFAAPTTRHVFQRNSQKVSSFLHI